MDESDDEPVEEVLEQIAKLPLDQAAAELTDAGDVGVGRFALLLSDAAVTFCQLFDLCHERNLPMDDYHDTAMIALGVTLVPVLRTPLGRPEHFQVPLPRWLETAGRAFQALKGFDFNAQLAKTPNTEEGEDPDMLLAITIYKAGLAFQRLMNLSPVLANTNENRRAVQRLLDERHPPSGPEPAA